MMSVTRFVGLDYHQDSVQVCVMDQEGRVLTNRSVDNHWRSIAAVLEELMDKTSGPVSVKASLESCSGAAHLAEELIEQIARDVAFDVGAVLGTQAVEIVATRHVVDEQSVHGPVESLEVVDGVVLQRVHHVGNETL